MANVFEIFRTAFLDFGGSVVDQICDQAIKNLLKRLVKFQLAAPLRVAAINFSVSFVKHGNFRAKKIEIEKARLKAIVQISGVISNFVHQIDELGFYSRPLVQAVFS